MTRQQYIPRIVWSQPNADTDTTRDFASWYWYRFGWLVLPAHRPCRDYAVSHAVALRCTCPKGAGCPCIGKHPIGEWRTVEHDADGWTRWRWAKPHVNIALLTGRRSRVVVADVDPRHGGALDALWALGWSQDTVAARSGGGGWHVFAQCPPGGLPSIDAYASGIEFKADGKLVILPPSSHRTQHPTNPMLLRRYHWLPGRAPGERAVAPLPESVIADIRARKRAERPATTEPPPTLTAEQVRKLASRAPSLVSRAVARARAGVDGGRHNTGVWLACQLRDLRVSDAVGRWAMLTYQHELEARHG